MLKLLGIKVSRGTRFCFNLLMLSLVWFYAYNMELGDSFHFTVTAFPFWLLISLGCYALYKIGLDLLILEDRPDEAQKLDSEVAAARAELSKKGLKLG